jgi:tetratricopeptide (TPR) repeat protein
MINLRADRLSDAHEAAWRAVEAMPRLSRPWLDLAWACEKLERLDEAIEACYQASAQAKRDPAPHLRLATLHRKLDERDEAIAALERALQLDPDFVQARQSLGELYVEQGEWKAAANQFEALCASSVNVPVWPARLAEIYERLNYAEDAESAWRRALEAIEAYRPLVRQHLADARSETVDENDVESMGRYSLRETLDAMLGQLAFEAGKIHLKLGNDVAARAVHADLAKLDEALAGRLHALIEDAAPGDIDIWKDTNFLDLGEQAG